MMPLPLQFLILLVAGWVSRQQQELIENLQEENRTPPTMTGAEIAAQVDRGLPARLGN